MMMVEINYEVQDKILVATLIENIETINEDITKILSKDNILPHDKENLVDYK
jgi:hypothetical protein